LEKPTALVTYHPVTLERGDSTTQVDSLLEAIEREGIAAVFTKANADAQGRAINRRIAEFCANHQGKHVLCDSLGQKVYLSCLRHLDLMIGNSSSGLIEAPSFRLPVVNIGDRQKGRIRAANVIDVDYGADAISSGIRRALTPEFETSLQTLTNPYEGLGAGTISTRIKEELKRVDIGDALLKKTFHDMPPSFEQLTSRTMVES
jgi:UDP-hydrolysing UDP-N-acetyl-D-glucosamine 2-epimerase